MNHSLGPAILSLSLASSLSAQSSSATDARAAELDAYVAKAVDDWMVTGLAMAVVKDGRLVFSGSYGVRQHGKQEPVDSLTLFANASTTKAMTAAALGMLVDEGKLKWDDPVSKHIPGFQLYDPYATREVTVRDLLTHRAGLGNADYLWDVADLDMPEIIRRVRHLRPAYSFRSGFIYQNVMYLIAGEVVAAVSGMPWERFVATRIFAPVGMRHTLPLIGAIPPGANVASPHYLYGGDTIAIVRNTQSKSLGPAGGAWSNISDMSRWMMFLLDSARIGGRRLISQGTFTELFRPQTIVPPNEFYPTAERTRPNWMTYSLGWYQHDYGGRMLSFHTGSLAGMVAIVGLVPSERLGVVVFVNLDHAELRHALMYRAIDHYTGSPARDWSRELHALYAARRARGDSVRRAAESSRVRGTRPSLAPARYAGQYADSLLGTVTVTEQNGRLRFDAGPAYKGQLEHWHYDQFRARYDDRWQGTDMVAFTIRDGVASALTVGGLTLARVRDPRAPGSR